MSKTNLNTSIGVLTYSYEMSSIVSVSDLKTEIDRGCYYTPRQYCDFRYATNLVRFNYDPYTGDKIDWKEVKKLLEYKE